MLLHQLQGLSDAIYAREPKHQNTYPSPPSSRESNANQVNYNRKEVINDRQSPFHGCDMHHKEEVHNLPPHQYSEINQECMMSTTKWEEILDKKI